VVSFTPQLLYLWGKSPSTHWIGGWVDPRAGLDSDPSVVQPVASRCTDYAVLADVPYIIILIGNCFTYIISLGWAGQCNHMLLLTERW
jgi:hypothetical protein